MAINTESHYKCRRCDGAGILLRYDYWKGGTCFACKGAGWFEKKRKTINPQPVRLAFVMEATPDAWPVAF